MRTTLVLAALIACTLAAGCRQETAPGPDVWAVVNGKEILRQDVEKIFRSINQTAYLISVPFLMILLLGIMVRSHPLSNLGAIVVVLLNITRLVTGFINLVVIPFRDGINFKRLKKPIRRVVEPAITIGLVGLAFAFIPWLSKSDTSDATFSGQLRAGVRKIERKFEDAKEKATDKAKALGIGPDDKKPES